MPNRFQLICAVIDVATSEQPRPLREFFRRPYLPIREMYLTRVVINLVYFARNYLNVILVCIAACAFVYPSMVLVLVSSGAIHVAKRSAASQKAVSALQVVQFSMCVVVLQQCGLLAVLLVNAIPMMMVASHAAFTPYTDEAMAHYENVMKTKGFSAPAPRSPTKGYEAVDKMFAAAAEASVATPRGTSSTAPTSAKLLAAKVSSVSPRGSKKPQQQSPKSPRVATAYPAAPEAAAASPPCNGKPRLLRAADSRASSWISTPGASSLPSHVNILRREAAGPGW